MIKKLINCLVVACICFTCTSCKAINPYLTSDYLNVLAVKSGIDVDGKDSLNSLIAYGVVSKENIDEYLDYAFLKESICNLVEDEEFFSNKRLIKRRIEDDSLISEDEASLVIDEAIKIINNKEFKSVYSLKEKEEVSRLNSYSYNNGYLSTDGEYKIGDYLFLEDDGLYKKVIDIKDGEYLLDDVSFEEIIEELHLQDSFELDMDEAIDIPGGDIEDSAYINNDRNLLASRKTKSFKSKGYNVSYNFSKSSINARISKNTNGVNMFFDIAVSGIKPSYKWDYKGGKLNDAYFKVSYKTVEEVGVSIGRYKNYYLDLKDKDAGSFLSAVKSITSKYDDEVETSIKICEIKTPISGIPSFYFNIDVLAKIYTSGKVEIVLANNKVSGFEIKDGNMRLINDNDRDIDFKIGSTSKAVLGLNFNIQAIGKYLMDVELDAGVKASVSTTLHLYDSDGNHDVISSDLDYSAVDELSKENNDVKTCGDVSLNWLLEIRINTSKTLLYKLGFWYKKEILNEKNQILGNKTHVENFILVDKCTRKDKLKKSKDSTTISPDKILLNKYSAVVVNGNTYTIEIKALPSGYSTNDLLYESKDSAVASVSNGIVKTNKLGACQIVISTSDGKYSTSINILVSSG